MKRISLIIPAYKPDQSLISTIESAIKAGFEDILVVDDGGGKDYEEIFDRVRGIEECTVLVHPKNRGKGAALKTAFRYFLDNRKDKTGVVTADADGQHRTEDIVAIAKKMNENGNIVLGYRNFSLPHVPARSKFGNKTTSLVFRLFFGMRIKDTQTGLRAFPTYVLEDMCKIKGDRYEYETHMLITMSRKSLPFDEVEIETVYIEENQSSHFRPIVDSMRIYAILIKYLLSSVLSTLVDVSVFFLIKQFAFLDFLPWPLTFTAGFIARAASSLVNFTVNSKVVFDEKPKLSSMVKYYILAIVQICISNAAVFCLEHVLHIDAPILSTLIKGAVDTFLFFLSFRIQHKWVFNSSDKRRIDK
ncbi:MAG: bifunctional glycosyltransferase family 2/GtrA family protein [Clostridia bacterium]|nr:bifunctional glycosyltransferase family 2/GtrA family protein [Clostridia bacterium]